MTNPSSTSPAANYDPEQEIRFAVVLYGGVSLAIYINGVTQELLRMVRGTANLPADEKRESTEDIYRELGQIIGLDGVQPIAATDLPAAPIRTRFVVDVISGSSAGGINGIALAKALALKRRNMGPLRDVWLDKAQLDTLLNDEASNLRKYPSRRSGKVTSLLNSERMYGMILETLQGMNAAGECTPNAPPFADNLDLFITATDLAGLDAPIQLTGQTIQERVHKVAFHFKHPGPNGKNEFEADHDAMLAFAGRCTSSFPVAFEPMRFADIEHQLGKHKIGKKAQTLEEAEKLYTRFFDPPVRGQDDKGRARFRTREFADGGYLDNRPFSYAIDVIEYRSTTRPVVRKLLFVDPFPDVHDKPDEQPDATSKQEGKEGDDGTSFLKNALLAGMSLPRYEIIRDDIRRITAANRRLERLNGLRERSKHDQAKLKDLFQRLPEDTPSNFPELGLRQMIEVTSKGREPSYRDPSYLFYHHLRVYNTTDVLADLLTRAAGFEIDSDQYSFLRLLLRAWREEHYAAYLEDVKSGMKTENAFLYEYDADYRMRRLNYLSSKVDELLKDVIPDYRPILKEFRKSVEEQLARLRDSLRDLGEPANNVIMDAAGAQTFRELLTDEFDDVMGQVGMRKQYGKARELYERPGVRHHIDEVMKNLAVVFEGLFDKNRDQITTNLASIASPGVSKSVSEELSEAHRMFHVHDLLSLPFLDGTDAREYAEVQVFRVSPADTASLQPTYMNNGVPKLAGPKFAAFGGFLQRPWREHDMMWGRLDGAERIITALLPDPKDKDRREHYIKEAHKKILEDEFATHEGRKRIYAWLADTLRDQNVSHRPVKELVKHGDRLMLQRFPNLWQRVNKNEFSDFLSEDYTPPPPPEPGKMANWAARSLKILGQMIDDLPGGTSKDAETLVARVFRSAGVLVATLLRFALPGSLWAKLIEHWLTMVGLAGLTLIIVGAVVAVDGLALVGYATIVLCLSVWIVLRMFGAWARDRLPFGTLAFRLFAAGVVGLALYGAAALASGVRTGQWPQLDFTALVWRS